MIWIIACIQAGMEWKDIIFFPTLKTKESYARNMVLLPHSDRIYTQMEYIEGKMQERLIRI